jgi:hypothetical protein
MTPVGTTKSVADEFLRFASDAISDPASNEGILRSAISRAYYAIFLLARDQLFGPDAVMLTKQTKKKLRRDFKKSANRDLAGSHQEILFAVSRKTITLSQQMRQLYQARINADYHLSAKNLASISHASWRDFAKETVELAQLIQQDTARLPRF